MGMHDYKEGYVAGAHIEEVVRDMRRQVRYPTSAAFIVPTPIKFYAVTCRSVNCQATLEIIDRNSLYICPDCRRIGIPCAWCKQGPTHCGGKCHIDNGRVEEACKVTRRQR